jgi:ubiquinone/menaquinone biosynthesis C-methylase UbiE
MTKKASNTDTPASRDSESRQLFESESVYASGTICLERNLHSGDFIDLLLRRKFELVSKYYRGGLLVDLCCATGEHLLHLAPEIKQGIGIDFSVPYLRHAAKAIDDLGASQIRLVGGSARRLPIASNSVDMLYCFSSLYVIARVEEVINEITRVLAPGGTCVLDLGASWSLNTICCRAYPEIAPSFHIPLYRMRRMLRDSGLDVIEHRAFQILPYWAEKPSWLRPLLHPFWKKQFQTVVAGKMLDEWISNLPLLKHLAFRHLFVARKCHTPAAVDS